MRTRMRRTTAVVAAVVLGAGGVGVAVPALAGGGPSASHVVASAHGPGWAGDARPTDGRGVGVRDGSCLTAPIGTLTEQQKATLAAQAEEEKLAHDLYVAFAGQYDAIVFDRIAAAETRHLDAVRTLLDRYQVPDPTAGQPAGRFADPSTQATYDTLLAQGRTSLAAALRVGEEVERTDIADLRAAQSGLSAPDVGQVYRRLSTASQHHLSAFQRWADR